MKQSIFKITENTAIAKNMFKMVLCGDTSAIERPGQFVNIKIDGLFLRRPISVCDYGENTLVIVYKTVGVGTDAMSVMKPGTELDILTGLGNGYSLEKSGENPLLIGGGAGVPPMYGLCRALADSGKKPTVILGFNSADEVFFEAEFSALGAKVIVTTADGTHGIRGFATDVMEGLNYSYIYSCGPLPMLRAVSIAAKTCGQLSLEERMGCGFGACMGCSIKTKNGFKRVCKDGPVFETEEILW